MKKIAILTHEYYPLLCGGTVFAEQMAKELSLRGNQVEVVCSSLGSAKPGRTSSDNFWIKRFWTARRSEKTASKLDLVLFMVLGMPQMMWYLRKNKFTHILSVFVIPGGLMGLIIQLLTGIPNFVFVDGGDVPGIESQQTQLMDRLKFLFRWVTKYSRGVFVLQGVEDFALPLIDNKCVAVIPNGTIIPSASVDFKEPRNTIKLLSIGRFVRRKGFHYIIEACGQLQKLGLDFRLDIIGYGDEEAALHKSILELGLKDRVSILGGVDYAELGSYYLNHDCYIFYGGREGSSLAMIEATAYGLPVIATDEPGSRAFVHEGINGTLVPWADPAKLSRAMQVFMEGKNKIEQMGHESRIIAKQYSWQNLAEKYDNVFASHSFSR